MAVGWSSSHAHGFGRYAGEPGRRPQGRTRFPGEVTGYVPPGWPEGVARSGVSCIPEGWMMFIPEHPAKRNASARNDPRRGLRACMFRV